MDSLQFLTEYRHIAVPALILLMAAESAPVVGFFLPGVLILPALGAMTASGVWPFWMVYASAFSGALLGDTLGYWLGRIGSTEGSGRFLANRRRKALQAARELVKEQGAMAIFFGRFAWLIHPAVPPAIGFLGVKLRTFLLIDSLAVSLWTLLYMGIGYLATGIWIKQTFEFIGVISLLVILVMVFVIARRAGGLVGRGTSRRKS